MPRMWYATMNTKNLFKKNVYLYRKETHFVNLIINDSCNWHSIKDSVGCLPDLFTKLLTKLINALTKWRENDERRILWDLRFIRERFLYRSYLMVSTNQEKL